MDITKFGEKLNRLDGRTYVIEEEVYLNDGVYNAELVHDNVNTSTIAVYTGKKLTGDRVDDYISSTPSDTPWKTLIRVYSDVEKLYISYETPGDKVEAGDINVLQDAVVNTQSGLNDEIERSSEVEQGLKQDVRRIDTELANRYTKDKVFTKSEVAAKIEEIIGSAPEALNTLYEIAEALGNDPNFAGTMIEALSKKVDKDGDKGLSENDYTDNDKKKLAGIGAGAEINVQSDWNVTDSASDTFIRNKPVIPNKTSELVNDAGFVTESATGPHTWNSLKGV